MTNMINLINEEELNNYIFIIDNLSSHLTNDLFAFYIQKN